MALQDRACRLDGDRHRLIEQVIRRVAGWSQDLGRAALRPAVLAALVRVPRDLFVVERQRRFAWADLALDLPWSQRLSQPSIVAVMTDLLDLEPHHRVLEVGTGSGYQTAVLSQLAAEVYSVELEEDLALSALVRLARLDCGNVAVRVGDGAEGWPKHAPFDRILLTAAAAALPSALVRQLAPGGRMVLPLGSRLVVVDKRPDGGLERSSLMPVRFVPLRHAPMIAFEAAS